MGDLPSYRPGKKELWDYIYAKASAKEIPAYFADGELHRGPFYVAMLGDKTVGSPTHECYLKDGGCYISKQAALEGAEIFRAKCREVLAEIEQEERGE